MTRVITPDAIAGAGYGRLWIPFAGYSDGDDGGTSLSLEQLPKCYADTR
jgi:hypothetical protein